MEPVYSHRPLRPTRPPVVPIIILGLWISQFAIAFLPFSVSPVVFWLIAIGLSILCGWQVARPGSFVVAIGVLLTIVGVTSFLPWWLEDSVAWNLFAAPLICVAAARLYMALVRRAFATPAATVRIPPFWIRNALVLLLLVQVLDLTLRWAYTKQSCTWIDLTRTLNGCRRLVAFPADSSVLNLSADGTRAATSQFIGELPDLEDDTEAFWRALQARSEVISLWDIGTGNVLRTLEFSSSVNGIELSRDGRLIATIDGDTQVGVWSVDDGTLKHTLSHGDDFVQSLAFSPDATILATGVQDASDSRQEHILLWSLHDGTVLRTIPVEDTLFTLNFSPDGSTLVASSGDIVRLWRISDGTLLQRIEAGAPLLTSASEIALSPDGQILALGGNVTDRDAERSADGSSEIPIAELWRVSDATLLHTLHIHDVVAEDSNKLWSSDLAFSEDGSRLAVGVNYSVSRPDAALIWRVADGALLQRIDNLIPQNYLRFTSDGTGLLFANRWGVYTQQIPAAAR